MSCVTAIHTKSVFCNFCCLFTKFFEEKFYTTDFLKMLNGTMNQGGSLLNHMEN